VIATSGGGNGPVSGPLSYFAAAGGLYYSTVATVHCVRVIVAWAIKRSRDDVKRELREIEADVKIRRR
jgi:hypothetical protein